MAIEMETTAITAIIPTITELASKNKVPIY